MFRSKSFLRLYLFSLRGFCMAEKILFLRNENKYRPKILHCFQISSSHGGGYFSQASESQVCRIKAWKNLLEEGCEQLQASLCVVCFCFSFNEFISCSCYCYLGSSELEIHLLVFPSSVVVQEMLSYSVPLLCVRELLCSICRESYNSNNYEYLESWRD